MRRVVDVVTSLVLIVLTAPVMISAMALLAVTAGRPVLFGHRRVGRGGRTFRCWKLRTMRVGAEAELERDPELGRRHRTNGFKLPNGDDPRVTAWGRWLRRTYVDEIPQLFNVLVGCMSLVGPRPVVPDELDLFGSERSLLLDHKPGVFGAWNSLGRARPPYPERAQIELDYVRRRTGLGDLRILLRSVWAVLQGQGDA
jgi:exopolysaccharide production protein ExoY